MKILCLQIALIVFPLSTLAAEPGEWFFSPHASVGVNSVQGTYFRLGLDTGLHFTETLHGGVGGYYAFGEKPQYDREIGAGPFVAYVLPLADFLLFSLREDIHYLDARIPVGNDAYVKETGVISGTSAAVHIFFTPNFVLRGGYRYVLALSNSALDNGRSGPIFGFGFGI